MKRSRLGPGVVAAIHGGTGEPEGTFPAAGQMESAAQPCARSLKPRMRADPSRDGYTLGMKTAVSIPDHIFERAERLANREHRSRSELYAAALDEYVARHAEDEVTDAMNRVRDAVGDHDDAFLAAAAGRLLADVEW